MTKHQQYIHCVECNKPAIWLRDTQFAGLHPYCDKHAREQSDFKENSSYTGWALLK